MSAQSSSKSKDSNLLIAVELTAMNVVYVGVENPLLISCSGIKSSELKVMVTNGKIKGSDGRYMVSPARTGTDSDRFTTQQKELLRHMQSGQKVYIDDIKATGPDGVTRNLNSIILKVQ